MRFFFFWDNLGPGFDCFLKSGFHCNTLQIDPSWLLVIFKPWSITSREVHAAFDSLLIAVVQSEIVSLLYETSAPCFGAAKNVISGHEFMAVPEFLYAAFLRCTILNPLLAWTVVVYFTNNLLSYPRAMTVFESFEPWCELFDYRCLFDFLRFQGGALHPLLGVDELRG